MNISLHYMYGFASGMIATSIIFKRKKNKVKNAKTQTIDIEPAKPMTKTIGIQTDPVQSKKRSIEVNTDHTMFEWHSVLPNILSKSKKNQFS